MLRFIDPANALTLTGLLLAFAATLQALSGSLHVAFALLIAAGLCDLFDGVIARRLRRNNEQRDFGKHLDSLSDACAFIFAPAIILFTSRPDAIPATIILGVFVIAGIWRLAYFDTIGLKVLKETAYFTGLPVTYSALVFPAVALLIPIDAETAFFALIATTATLAVLMVAPINIPKPRGSAFIVLPIVAVTVMTLHLYLAIYS